MCGLDKQVLEKDVFATREVTYESPSMVTLKSLQTHVTATQSESDGFTDNFNLYRGSHIRQLAEPAKDVQLVLSATMHPAIPATYDFILGQ